LEKKQNKLINLYLELTKTCNLSCSYCYVPTYNKNQKKQTEEQADIAVDEFIEKFSPENGFDIAKIIFHGSETFVLEPEAIAKTIDKLYPVQKMPLMGVQTNGVALTPEYHDRMGDYSDKLLISFSLDARPVHNKYRNDSFDLTWANLLESKKRGYNIKALSVVTKEVVNNHLEDLEKLLKDLEDLDIQCDLKFAHGSELYTLTADEQVKLGDWGMANGYWKRVQGMSPAYCSFGKCRTEAISEISYDGGVYVCNKINGKEDEVGNWKTEPLEEVFAKRDNYPNTIGYGAECSTCVYWNVCLGGCPSDRDKNGYAIDCAFKHYVWGTLWNKGGDVNKLFSENLPAVFYTKFKEKDK